MSLPPSAAAVENLEPKLVWKYFGEMSAIPRPSKQEEQIREHMRKTADELGFEVREDEIGNMVICVPASPGCENVPITVLQGHLDMVCEKNSGTQHNFDTDPIQLVLARDEKTGEPIVHAAGTTLGADNGIGLALGLAAATDPNVTHGPLEILCTIDEEQGMTGVKALDTSIFAGRRMLNLDSEEDDAIYIGCAGGADSTLSWPLPLANLPSGSAAWRVVVAGLRGGHSGGDIHENRGNAIKILARTLREADPNTLQLVEFTGGSKRNAIPREASALVVGPKDLNQQLAQSANGIADEAKQAGEPGCTITIEPAQATSAITPNDTARVLATLIALPHGVLALVPEIPGLVETSNSTSTVTSTVEQNTLIITIGCLSRSSSQPELHSVVRQIAATGELAGAMVESGNEYPGWQPDIDSKLLKTCRQVYQDLFKEEPNVTAIHAGLECGLLGERVGAGQMDMVSMGPRITGAHSPDERVYVDSVAKSYKLLSAVLSALAKG